MKIEDILKSDELILYHGSRGGLSGNIKPISREKCDFGKGFYMGTNPIQAKGLIVEDSDPMFYTLKLSVSKIPKDDILVLENEEWLFAVLANRNKIQEFNDLKLAQEILEECNQYDFIIGAIADDRMNEAMKRYAENGLTDKGLEACLQSVDYGFQIAAKTQRACDMIQIISYRDIYGQEADNIRDYVRDKRIESRKIVTEMSKKYVRQGKYLSELIEEQSNFEDQFANAGKKTRKKEDSI